MWEYAITVAQVLATLMYTKYIMEHPLERKFESIPVYTKPEASRTICGKMTILPAATTPAPHDSLPLQAISIIAIVVFLSAFACFAWLARAAAVAGKRDPATGSSMPDPPAANPPADTLTEEKFQQMNNELEEATELVMQFLRASWQQETDERREVERQEEAKRQREAQADAKAYSNAVKSRIEELEAMVAGMTSAAAQSAAIIADLTDQKTKSATIIADLQTSFSRASADQYALRSEIQALRAQQPPTPFFGARPPHQPQPQQPWGGRQQRSPYSGNPGQAFGRR